MSANPLDDADENRLNRIRERAYHLWEADGRPDGRQDEYWDRASTLVGMEDSAGAGQVPVQAERPEEADIQDNLGEFPDRLTDQGGHPATPSRENLTRTA